MDIVSGAPTRRFNSSTEIVHLYKILMGESYFFFLAPANSGNRILIVLNGVSDVELYGGCRESEKPNQEFKLGISIYE